MASRTKTHRKCAALTCTSTQAATNVSFFSFPVKSPEALTDWMNAVETRPGFIPTKNTYLCELHFDPADLVTMSQGSKSPGCVRKRLRPHSRPRCEWNSAAPILLPAASATYEPPAPDLRRFDEDLTREEQRIEEEKKDQRRNAQLRDSARHLRRTHLRRHSTRARRHAAVKQRTRKLRGTEAKLEAASLALKREIQRRRDPDDAIKQFNAILTEKGQEMFRNPARELSGAYSEELRRFSSELLYCSPRGYKILRRYFHLPSASTIRRWNRFDCPPGITTVSVEKIGELCSSHTMRDWTLVIDAMHIRRQLCFTSANKRITGFEDVGVGSDCFDERKLACEAVVLLAVSLRSSWKLPVAYIFSASATPAQQSHLIRRTVEELNNVGACVRALVCDCAAVNIATIKLLGANIPDAPHFTPNSQHEQVYVFFDNCHLLKLVRNSFSDMRNFVYESTNISWKFIELLHAYQQVEGGRLGNKLSSKHLEWRRLKMKVSLAAQTLSTSVADALQFLIEAGYHDFRDCTATVTFIRTIDTLFDIFNSR